MIRPVPNQAEQVPEKRHERRKYKAEFEGNAEFMLTNEHSESNLRAQWFFKSLFKGKTVKIRRGPAAVSEDEHRRMPLFDVIKREGAVIRKIHKPEDLPGEERRFAVAAN